jgi:hypothetical protein
MPLIAMDGTLAPKLYVLIQEDEDEWPKTKIPVFVRFIRNYNNEKE